MGAEPLEALDLVASLARERPPGDPERQDRLAHYLTSAACLVLRGFLAQAVVTSKT